MRNGVIEDVGADRDRAGRCHRHRRRGLTVYPGLIDMANASAVDDARRPRRPARPGGAAGGAAARARADARGTRAREARELPRGRTSRPRATCARGRRDAAARVGRHHERARGAVAGLVTGQSALDQRAWRRADDPQISTIADYRRGLVVVKSPVALHVSIHGRRRGGGGGYPGVAARHDRVRPPGVLRRAVAARRARVLRAAQRRPRPVIEPVLDALAPALDASCRSRSTRIRREIARARAREGVQPRSDHRRRRRSRRGRRRTSRRPAPRDLLAELPDARRRPARRRRWRRAVAARPPTKRRSGADPRASERAEGPGRAREGDVPFAFTSGGLQDLSLLRPQRRAHRQGRRPARPTPPSRAHRRRRAAWPASPNRLGTIEKGKIANLVVTEGDCSDGTRIRHVFIDGRPVEIDTAEPAGGRGRGRATTPNER